MRRAVVVFALVVAVVGGPAIALAGSAVATPTETPTATPTEAGSTTVVEQVDEDVRVVDYNYADGVFSVTLENTGDRTRATITEVISPDQGETGTFGIEQVALASGETVTVEVSVDPTARTTGVMITTAASVEQGTGTYLQERSGGGGILDGSATWADVRAGALFAGVGSLLLTLLGAWHLVASSTDDVEDADLEPKRRVWR